MILSKDNLFVFIKGKKVAGTSVEVLLSSICGPEDIITPITPIDEKYRVKCGYRCAQNYGANNEDHNNYISSVNSPLQEDLIHVKHPKSAYYNHMPLTRVLDLFGEITEEWLVFAVERCPYHKIISLANMQLGFKQYQKSGKVMESDIESLKSKISEIINNKKMENVKNIDLYKDREGYVRTHILRFEKLHEDIEKLMMRLHVKAYPKLPHLKKGISTNKIELSDIFSIEQLKTINEVFYQEFDLYGYKMIFS
jgi:hypothetical protein